MLSIHKKKALTALALLLLAAAASALYQSKKEFGSTADSPSSSLSNKPVPPVKLYATASRGAMVTSKLALGSVIVAEDSGVIVDVDYDRGWFDIQFNNLPALIDGRFLATGFANVFSMSNVPASPFPVSTSSVLNVSPLQFFPNSTAENKLLRIYARVTTSSPLGRAEVLVTDTSGATICSQIAAVGVDAVCDSTVQVALTGTGAAQIFTYRAYGANSGAVSTTKLRAAVMDASDFDSGFSGPAKAAAFETVKARYYYTLKVINRGDEQMRIIRVYSSPGVLVKEFPVITRWNGKNYAAMPLLGFPGSVPYQMTTTFADREIVDRAFVDVPVNAQSMTFRASRRAITPSAITSGMPRDIDLYLQHDVGPNGNSVVPPIPFQNATVSVTTPDSNSTSSESITLNVVPGRWYVIGKSKTGEAMHFNLSATFNTFSPPPAFKFGHYFNPSRPGHGVYLDKVSGQWIMLWYTYLEDGTPTWYIAQAAAPNEDQGFSIWEASLRRVVWNGNTSFNYSIGSVRVTLLGDSSFQFNYIVDGEAGGETFTRLGSQGCATSRGSNFDVSGLWYSPSKSGFGYSTEIISGQEFIPTYIFDQSGMPRWLIGQKSFVDGVSTIDMKQLSGFCPLCTYRATTSQTTGSMSRTITATAAPDNAPGYSNMGVSAGFLYPLRGNWNENLPAAMLTERKACQ